MTQKFDKEELRKRLTPLQYQVTQEAGTERPYSGKLSQILVHKNTQTHPTMQYC